MEAQGISRKMIQYTGINWSCCRITTHWGQFVWTFEGQRSNTVLNKPVAILPFHAHCYHWRSEVTAL